MHRGNWVVACLVIFLSGNCANRDSCGELIAQETADPSPTIRKPITPTDHSLPLLVAPFSAEQAKQHQETCAKHLGIEVEITNRIGAKLTLIPAGEFQMGSHESSAEFVTFAKNHGYARMPADSLSDEFPLHQVRLTNPFFIGTHEVTFGEFRRFVQDTGYLTEAESDGKGGLGYHAVEKKIEQNSRFTWKNPGWTQSDKHPVVNVSWNDATRFCAWLSRLEGETYQLPTEAQWEFACRAGTTGRLFTGNVPADLEGSANVGDQAFQRIPGFGHLSNVFSFDDGTRFTSPVGRYRKNPFGLCDMHGNVWEWCRDWYDSKYYASSPRDNPTGPTEGEFHVYRGGGWINDPVGCRSARRGGPSPASRCNRLGFRVVRSVAASTH